MTRTGRSGPLLPGLPLLLVAALVVALAPVTQAQQFVTTGRDTLRGLPGVEVVIEPFDADLARGGLSVAAIHQAVVDQLQAARVPVFTSQRRNPSPAQPYLYVAVTGLSFDAGAAWAVALQVEVRQTVRSTVTESRIVDAVTWDQHTVIVLPTRELPNLKGEIVPLVAAFVADWTSTHPPASRAAPPR